MCSEAAASATVLAANMGGDFCYVLSVQIVDSQSSDHTSLLSRLC